LKIGVMLSLFPLEEMAKDAGVEIQKSPDHYSGVTFAINVDQPEQVDTAIEQDRSSCGKILREPNRPLFGRKTQLISPIL
jgi:hypothetical protein